MDRKGRFTVFYQPDTNLIATSTIILHLNWLDLFERFVGNLMTMSLQSGHVKKIFHSYNNYSKVLRHALIG